MAGLGTAFREGTGVREPRPKPQPDAPAKPQVYWPIVGGERTVTSSFGVPRTGHTHAGIDLPARFQPVVATVGGRVISSVESKGGYGRTIIIRDKHRYEHLYAHLDSREVLTGQMVEAGQRIGVSGNSGRSTGPHLHYEIRNPLGRSVDPGPFFDDGDVTQLTSTTAGKPVSGSGDGSGAEAEPQQGFGSLRSIWQDSDPFDILRSVNDILGVTSRGTTTIAVLDAAADRVAGLFDQAANVAPYEEEVTLA